MGTKRHFVGRLASKRYVAWFVTIFVLAGILVTGVILGRTGNTSPGTRVLDISTGQHLTFQTNGSGSPSLMSGWSSPEAWGTWSNQDQSTLALKLKVLPKHDLNMVIEGRIFLFGSHKSLVVKVDVNGKFVTSITYGPGDDQRPHSISIPLKIISSDGGRLLVRFSYNTPKSPQELGMSKDPRKLGLGITGLQFNN
jgi:hypothetical protein